MIHPDSYQLYFEFPDPPLYHFPDGTNVQVLLSGSSVFPAIDLTTLRSPVFDPIEVTAPTVPADGVLPVASTAPFEIQWDVPSARDTAFATHRHGQRVAVRLFALSPVQWGVLYCSWPLSSGHGVVPVVLLSEFRRLLGSTGAVEAVVDLLSGDFKEIATLSSSYVLYGGDISTTFPRSTSAIFE